MKVKFTVKANMSGVPAKVSAICKDPAVGIEAANTAERLMQRYVPERDKFLKDSTTVTPFMVTYNTPYAHYQYEGRRIRHRTKAGSMSHWDRGLSNVPANKAALANAITAFLKR